MPLDIDHSRLGKVAYRPTGYMQCCRQLLCGTAVPAAYGGSSACAELQRAVLAVRRPPPLPACMHIGHGALLRCALGRLQVAQARARCVELEGVVADRDVQVEKLRGFIRELQVSCRAHHHYVMGDPGVGRVGKAMPCREGGGRAPLCKRGD